MEDTLFEFDIIVEDEILDMLVRDPHDTLALADRFEPWMDGTCVKLYDEDRIEAFVPGNHFDYSETEQYYNMVNIYKFSRTFSETYYVPFLMA